MKVQYKSGGDTRDGNRMMLKNQAVEFKHHAQELSNAVKKAKHVDAWVVAKAERATTDLSDITHYLDGQSGKYAKGGVTYIDARVKDTDYYRKHYTRYPNAIGSFAWGIKESSKSKYNSLAEGILYPLDEFDREYYAHLLRGLRKGEYLFRYRTDRMPKDEKRLIKINLDKSLVYFMDSENMDKHDDKTIKFLTRGVEATYIVVEYDKLFPALRYEHGGETSDEFSMSGMSDAEVITMANSIVDKEVGSDDSMKFSSGYAARRFLREYHSGAADVDENEIVDYFSQADGLPEEVIEIVERYSDIEHNTDTLSDMRNELEGVGYIFDHDDDMIPHSLRPADMENSEEHEGRMYAEGGKTKDSYADSLSLQNILNVGDILTNAVGKRLKVYAITPSEYVLLPFGGFPSPWRKDRIHELVKTGEWVLDKFKEKGGEIEDEGESMKEDFLEDVEELHGEIKSITLKDGSKISHKELMQAHKMGSGGMMARGGIMSNSKGISKEPTLKQMKSELSRLEKERMDYLSSRNRLTERASMRTDKYQARIEKLMKEIREKEDVLSDRYTFDEIKSSTPGKDRIDKAAYIIRRFLIGRKNKGLITKLTKFKDSLTSPSLKEAYRRLQYPTWQKKYMFKLIISTSGDTIRVKEIYADGGMMADGGIMAKGGEIRKVKGRNFSEQIENNQRFKSLIQRVYDEQVGEKYPMEFIRATALSSSSIVKWNGKNYLRGADGVGVLSHYEFMDDPNFIQALDYVDRPKIRSMKNKGGMMQDGGMPENNPVPEYTQGKIREAIDALQILAEMGDKQAQDAIDALELLLTDSEEKDYKITAYVDDMDTILGRFTSTNEAKKFAKDRIGEYEEIVFEDSSGDTITVTQSDTLEDIDSLFSDNFQIGQSNVPTSMDRLKSIIRDLARKSSGDEGNVVYMGSEPGQFYEIGGYEGLKPQSSQANSKILEVNFYKDNTQYVFTNEFDELTENRQSYEKYRGNIYLFIPMTNAIAAEIISKYFSRYGTNLNG